MPKILFIDDQWIQLSVYKRSLENKVKGRTGNEEDFTIVTASGHADALKKLDAEQPPFDLIITDYDMPGVNGVELAGKIRGIEAYKNTPIILHTSHSLQAMKEMHGQAIAALKMEHSEKDLQGIDNLYREIQNQLSRAKGEGKGYP